MPFGNRNAAWNINPRCVGFVLLSRNSGPALLSRAWSAVTGRTLSIDVSQPTVVNRIQQLQRLETVVYNHGQNSKRRQGKSYLSGFSWPEIACCSWSTERSSLASTSPA